MYNQFSRSLISNVVKILVLSKFKVHDIKHVSFVYLLFIGLNIIILYFCIKRKCLILVDSKYWVSEYGKYVNNYIFT